MLRTKELQDFYKTTPMREGILCWYPFERGASVLDFSGGALTELFERSGLRVYSEVGENISFDYIVVLDPTDFGVDALRGYKEKLSEHGRLLLAYENPFGLRYWAGKSAPNTHLPYDTLFGRGESSLPSKVETQTRLKRAGFSGQKWYYPLTDHWFAREIYSEDYLPNEFLNQRFVPYIEDDYSLMFDERELYREVIRGGAFEFMCGAYLVEARVCATDAACAVDYAAVTAYREPSKRFATTVRNDGTVRKKPLHENGAASVQRVFDNHKELLEHGINVVPCRIDGCELVMPKVDLPTLWDYWADKHSCDVFDESEMFGQFDRLRDTIYKAAKTGKCFWELVPANCFYDAEKDDFIFFDQEFYWEDVDIDLAVERSILALTWSSTLRHDERIAEWLGKLREKYGLADKWEQLDELADKGTLEEVFNPSAARSLERAAERAAERAKYAKMLKAVSVIEDLKFTKPAIYGYGVRGKRLRMVLENYGIDLACVIDKETLHFIRGLVHINDIDELTDEFGADSIIVTPLKDGEKIAQGLRGRTTLPVFVLEDLINE